MAPAINKKQFMYVGLGLLVLFVFLSVMSNTTRYSGSGYHGYNFGGNLAKTAASASSNSAMAAPPSKMSKPGSEGFIASAPFKEDKPEWRLEKYLDDTRGPTCATSSFGVTASGGPLCLTEDQARAMRSRGGNTSDSGCAL
jgi:hypothetical protein